jgi:hypothetical protein
MPTRSPLNAAKISSALAFALIALALPASAFGQATRTWVSGVGDDANPCSRTAPCKTFAGAISKTATNGEINCLDPGGFGGVTITKAITIKCHYTEGGVLVSGTNAIVVNAPATANVVLRGLDINGLTTGLNGVRILSAKSVKILDSEIYGFTGSGVDAEENHAAAKVGVYNNHIHDNGGSGVLVAPTTGGNVKGELRNNIIEDNNCGVVATTFGAGGAGVVICGTSDSTSGVSARATVSAINNHIADHLAIGILSRGNKGTVRYGANAIVHNTTGIQATDAGAQLLTWGDNYFGGNGSDGGSTGTATKA